jgi:hypothetical protein
VAGTVGLVARQSHRADAAPVARDIGVVSVPTASPNVGLGTDPATDPATDPGSDGSSILATHSTELGAQGSNADAPAWISIPRLKVHVAPAATGLAADNRSLDLPESARTVVWWAYGATPGSSSGTVLLAGHISWAGRLGVLGRIGTLRLGDQISITRRDGVVVRYAVVGRRKVPKASLADLGLFQVGGAPRLVLVTCGGRYDPARHSYEDNVVVQARPI